MEPHGLFQCYKSHERRPHRPVSPPTPRHHRLKGQLATGTHDGRTLPYWQIEVTGSGRIWYLVDEDRKTVWMHVGGPGHPKPTD